jgi:hypothetical protein
MENQLIADATATTKATTNKINPAKEITFIAELCSATVADNGNTVLTLAKPDGTIEELWVNEGFWAKLSNRIKEGDYLSVKAEKRVAGKTTYLDNDDELQFHTKDGIGFKGASKVSKSLFDRDIPANLADIDLITTAVPEAMNAIASYLGATRSAQIRG